MEYHFTKDSYSLSHRQALTPGTLPPPYSKDQEPLSPARPSYMKSVNARDVECNEGIKNYSQYWIINVNNLWLQETRKLHLNIEKSYEFLPL
jgi:hypothetical protein